MTLICVPLSPRNTRECVAKMVQLAPQCDLFEIRADKFEVAPDLPQILGDAARPVVWTHRSVAEGGGDNPRQLHRLAEYREALSLGARWVDVEWKSGLAEPLSTASDRLVLSLHDFEQTPADLLQTVASMAETPAAVIKVATQVNQTADLVRLVECARWLRQQARKSVIIGLGDDGKLLRILAPFLEAEWTYAALDQPTAGGQLTGADLDLYRFRRLSSTSRIYAVIGNPVAHSQSPRLHNSAYATMEQQDAVYVAVRVDNLNSYLRLADDLKIAGWSVTLPWKKEMAAHCLLQDDASRSSGVVNTVRRDGNSLAGWNTDWFGFLEPLRKRKALIGLRACVLGTGGVARTAVTALLSEKADVIVLGRRREALQALAAEFSIRVALLDQNEGVSGDLIVNTTPVGMWPMTEATPAPAALLSRFRIAYDLVYRPRQTMFLRMARELGLQVISGWEMFVLQAVEQVRIFTGREPSPEWTEAQLSEKDGSD